MIFQSIKMAGKSMVSNKMRSFLTMLGIIIGVVALVVLVSLAEGASSSVTESMESLGTNLFTIRITDDKENPLKLSELTDVMDLEHISMAAPIAQTSVTGKSGYSSSSIVLFGTTAPYVDIQGLELAAGRFLKSTDVENHTYTAVLNETAATELLGRTDVVGETVKLDGRSFEVVGVLKEEESTFGSQSENLMAYIPFTTLTRIADNILNVTSFYAASVDEESMDAGEEELTSYLLSRFGEDEDAFSLTNQSTLLEAMGEVTNTLSLMLGGIAAISLLVGGIGIMNIMMVSVTERTKEIGIRKAIGAGRGSIMFQFLMEAFMLSLLGCIAGIGASWGILKVISLMASDSINCELSISVVWIAVGFSVAVGVLFGLYPANKAARKHPIDAFRYAG